MDNEIKRGKNMKTIKRKTKDVKEVKEILKARVKQGHRFTSVGEMTGFLYLTGHKDLLHRFNENHRVYQILSNELTKLEAYYNKLELA